MKNILIASYDLEIGGVERSLISMLEQFDYENYSVDLKLYKHQGDFMPMLTNKVNLLKEVPEYATFRKSIVTLLKEKNYSIATSRILAKLQADIIGKIKRISEPGYYQMQLMWKYAMPFLPEIEKEYDVAISYLWPHDFVAEKVKAKKKIAWIHTDYSAIEIDEVRDIKVWSKFDYIVAVSDACKNAFIRKYPEFKYELIVLENLVSYDFIQAMSTVDVPNQFITDSRFKIVTVARLSHAKGIDMAVRALKLLKEKGYEEIAWYVVGYGGDEAKLIKLIADLELDKDFILLGKKSNPYPYIQASDLYVQPSRYEGKAVTVTEAQVLGKPILITNYSTSGSQIENGKNGLICEMSSFGIAKGIENLYLNRQKLKSLSDYNRKYSFVYEGKLTKLYDCIEVETEGLQKNELIGAI
ncbi:glycosyltransferase [Bacillus haimaensis]|uniref:glycosyltransferase n=1 Tax=Bacillus haimaensis TaxID=3160967 RepID=UPI003AA8C40B